MLPSTLADRFTPIDYALVGDHHNLVNPPSLSRYASQIIYVDNPVDKVYRNASVLWITQEEGCG